MSSNLTSGTLNEEQIKGNRMTNHIDQNGPTDVAKVLPHPFIYQEAMLQPSLVLVTPEVANKIQREAKALVEKLTSRKK